MQEIKKDRIREEGIGVRVPRSFYNELEKTRQEHQLSNLGSALLVHVEKRADEKVKQLREELNLDEVKQMIEMEKAATSLLWLVVLLGVDAIGEEKIKSNPVYQSLLNQLSDASEKGKLEIPKGVEQRIRITDDK